jgi:hypothetical protein
VFLDLQLIEVDDSEKDKGSIAKQNPFLVKNNGTREENDEYSGDDELHGVKIGIRNK